MLKNRIMVGIIAGSAVLIPLAGVAATSGPAGAKATGIKCTAATGKVNGTTGVAKITISGCSGNTGGSGSSKGSATSTSSTVNWHNGKSTTFSETATPDGTNCAATTSKGSLAEDEVLTGNVSADSTGSTKVGAPISGELCVYSSASGKLTIQGAPGVDFVIAKKA